MWEVTLAIPYGWWNFRDEQMLGVRITAWDSSHRRGLPLDRRHLRDRDRLRDRQMLAGLRQINPPRLLGEPINHP